VKVVKVGGLRGAMISVGEKRPHFPGEGGEAEEIEGGAGDEATENHGGHGRGRFR
jgi:hypothetical protein